MAAELAGVIRFRGVLGTRYLRLLRRDRAAAGAAMALVLLLGVALILPPLLGGIADEQRLELSNLAPFGLGHGWRYVLGADPLGRSLLVRLVIGARTSLLISLAAVGVAALVGTAVGTVTGYLGGLAEALVMRLADIVMSFPSLLLALITLYLLGSDPYVIVLVLGITRIPVYLRTSRAQAKQTKQELYVEAARVLGLRAGRIIVRHALPSVVPTILTLVTVEFGFVMLTESALSFLGIGVQPPATSWGLMVADGRGYLQTAWWLSVFPGLAISLTVLAANIVASWARLASDPKQRWRFDRDPAAAPAAPTDPELAPSQEVEGRRP